MHQNIFKHIGFNCINEDIGFTHISCHIYQSIHVEICARVCCFRFTLVVDYVSVWLSFLPFCLVTAALHWFKISLRRVRCVRYIIGAVTSWITRPMLWMCQYYEVLSPDLMGSVSADERWPAPTRQDGTCVPCVTLPIPGYCFNKMVYPPAICPTLYLWLDIYLITFFPAVAARLTRARSSSVWQKHFPSFLQLSLWANLIPSTQNQGQKRETHESLATLSIACLLSNM